MCVFEDFIYLFIYLFCSFAIFFLVQTGGDGCICYVEYDRDRKTLEFVGMKQVKELSLIQSLSAENNSIDDLASGCYAAGFASVDFIIWNLITETKVLSGPCAK